MNDYFVNMAHNESEKMILARMHDLLGRAERGAICRSPFLDLRQQELARAVASSSTDINWQISGGYEQAERKRMVIGPPWCEDLEDNIDLLRIESRDPQGKNLGHRDYLGAALNLGLNREKLGDIVVQEGAAILFLERELRDFLVHNLRRVKHSPVKVEAMARQDFVFQVPENHLINSTIASLRLDAVIAAAFHLSRSEVDALIIAGRVKVNQVDASKCSLLMRVGDLISVQGQGRFRLYSVGNATRKGRLHATLLVY